MTFLRNVWADLVDKRLWPVALVLVIAVIALPVLLLNGGGDEHIDVASNAPSAGAASSGQAIVAVDSQGGRRVALTGSQRNPFEQRGGGGDAGTSTTSSSDAPGPAPASGSGSSASTGGGVTGGSGSGSNGSTSTSTDTGSSATGGGSGSASSGGGSSNTTTTATDVVVRFGKEGSSARRAVQPMEALPSQSHPSVVYLGVDRGKAAFLMSSDVKPADGTDCHPSDEVCQKALVAPGHRIKLTTGDGDSTTTYVIEVSSAGS